MKTKIDLDREAYAAILDAVRAFGKANPKWLTATLRELPPTCKRYDDIALTIMGLDVNQPMPWLSDYCPRCHQRVSHRPRAK